VTRRLIGVGVLLAALVTAGCAASKALRQGDAAIKTGDYDQAVAFYRKAVQDAPNNPNYKIALQRAMLVASRMHLERAKDYEDHDQLEAARSEYKLASEYDPGNGFATLKIASLDQKIRDRIEAARPHPMDELRERARAASAPPLLNPASHELINLHFTNTRVGDVLSTIANASGINATYDRDAQAVIDRPMTINIDGLTVEQALNMVMAMNQLSYKVVNDRSIFAFQDTATKHTAFDDQVIKTFYIANVDVTELAQTISALARFAGITTMQPIIMANKTSNTITIRATAPVVDIIEKMIQQNDKPKAEIMFDVEILEVDRNRAKQYGLNLTNYAVGGIFSPVTAPGATATTGTTGTGGTTTATASTSGAVLSSTISGLSGPPAFNLNTISQGVATTDFYLAVPAAIVQFLESDTHTKLIAKPQLRGADGAKITVALGQQVPIVSTSYTPIATGGAGVNPLNSFTLKDVGINIEITARVTLDGDVSLDLMVESSTQGPQQNIAGTNYPSFGERKITTHLRLRDGESDLLAGLLQEQEQNALTGFPGAVNVPILKQLFSSTNYTNAQTDIVMLLTPHIIRTSEITESDLKPIYIGSQQNLGVGGPPPLIAAPADQPAPAPAPAPPVPQAPPPGATQPNTVPGGVIVAPPPGSSPVPGTVVVPPTQGLNAPSAAPEPATAPSAALSVAAAAPPATATTLDPPPGAAPPSAVPPMPVTTLDQTGAQAGTAPIVGTAQVIITPPATTFRVGGGPYTVPLSVMNASRLSTVTLTLTFDPAVLRVRSVQEGSFMQTGGISAVFTDQVGAGRVDITITRPVDSTGASGSGLLGAVLFDAVSAGTATLTASGAATGPGGTAMGLQFRPVIVTVQQ
jgi:general secretion pathway protein D